MSNIQDSCHSFFSRPVEHWYEGNSIGWAPPSHDYMTCLLARTNHDKVWVSRALPHPVSKCCRRHVHSRHQASLESMKEGGLEDDEESRPCFNACPLAPWEIHATHEYNGKHGSSSSYCPSDLNDLAKLEPYGQLLDRSFFVLPSCDFALILRNQLSECHTCDGNGSVCSFVLVSGTELLMF